MAKENNPDQVKCDVAFEWISKNAKQYLPAVNNVLITADIQSIRIIEDIKKILSAKNIHELATVLYFISPVTTSQLEVAQGYNTTISLSRLQTTLNSIKKEYEKQTNKPDIEEMKQTIKQLNQLVMKQENEKEALYKNITDILKLTDSFTIDALQKMRFTAGKTKASFKRAQNALQQILQVRRANNRNPGTVNVDKLRRIYLGNPEEYYK